MNITVLSFKSTIDHAQMSGHQWIIKKMISIASKEINKKSNEIGQIKKEEVD